MLWNFYKFRWITFPCVCVLLILSYYFAISKTEFARMRSTTPLKISQRLQPKRKLILDWTTFFGEKFSDSPTLDKLGCRVSTCDLTNDRSMFEVSDAVVFHWRDIDLKDMPQKRKRQRWILRNYENPFYVTNSMLEYLQHSIDWTVSYRLDSDISSFYGLTISRKARNPDSMNITVPPTVPVIDERSFSQRKSIAWMVSHCDVASQRDFLALELKKFIDVDIYGGCNGGDSSSLRGISSDQGFKKLSKEYKLYLSFENALCRDYATEKVFLPLHYGLIPVVWGAANYPDLVPPNSFVDVKNFSTIEDIASHLKKVVRDYDLYSSYFEWRKDYYVPSIQLPPTFLCDICAKLYSDQDYDVKRIVNLTSWWNINSDCVVPNYSFALPPLRKSINSLYSN